MVFALAKFQQRLGESSSLVAMRLWVIREFAYNASQTFFGFVALNKISQLADIVNINRASLFEESFRVLSQEAAFNSS